MATSTGARVFAVLVLLACVAVIAGGGWYFFGRDLFPSDETASDDDDDEIEPTLDGGTHAVHRPGKRHGKGHLGKGASATHPHAANYGPAGKSYEAAIAGNREQIAIGAGSNAADLTDAQLAGPMRNASFIGGCGAPDSMHATVKVAIHGGRAVGVSVYTAPPNAEIAACIDHAVRSLAWPVNGKMDSFVTNY